MMRAFLRSKIEGAVVTESSVARPGSVVLDQHLMHAAELLAFEKVEVYNLSSGTRFDTYVAKGRPGSGEVRFHGAAAHLTRRGDKIIIASYAYLHTGQMLAHKAKLVTVDEQNRITAVREESPG